MPNAEAYVRNLVKAEVDEDKQCDYCKENYRPFEACTVFEGHLSGSCTNCHYNGEGCRCSFHPTHRPRKRERGEENDGDVAEEVINGISDTELMETLDATSRVVLICNKVTTPRSLARR